ncbi:hypothetical protein QBC35DRAFT_452951 [Podospora australis]|uniref:Uncharacterized protein n=1 Tax=Podospora australis TaxID=1536484 RepID=A0AAN7AGX2_9PEZI|nr:hypothetical protein QBC35DRAFT_452951 [Podospora australis]
MLLAVFSNSRRIGIFAATAKFAAVEVVFIGTTIGNAAGGAGGNDGNSTIVSG